MSWTVCYKVVPGFLATDRLCFLQVAALGGKGTAEPYGCEEDERLCDQWSGRYEVQDEVQEWTPEPS